MPFFKSNTSFCYLNHIFMKYWPFAYIVSRSVFLNAGGYDFPCNYYEDLDLLIKYNLNGIKLVRAKGFGLAIRLEADDISHLSNSGDKFEFAMQTLNSRYGKRINNNKISIIVFNMLIKALPFLLKI